MTRKPTRPFTFHPDYDDEGYFYCMNAWDTACPHATHNEKFDTKEEALDRMEFRVDHQTIPAPLRRIR